MREERYPIIHSWACPGRPTLSAVRSWILCVAIPAVIVAVVFVLTVRTRRQAKRRGFVDRCPPERPHRWIDLGVDQQGGEHIGCANCTVTFTASAPHGGGSGPCLVYDATSPCPAGSSHRCALDTAHAGSYHQCTCGATWLVSGITR